MTETMATIETQQPAAANLRTVITVLALADGVLHLTLDFVLFHGNFFGGGPGGPPRGAPPRGAAPPPGGPGFRPPLPLNELFVLNLVGYVILVALLWLAPRWLGTWRWLVDVAMIVYVAVVFAAWLEIGRPNPMGLGYLSKAIEVLLVLALLAHLWRLAGERRTPASLP